MVYVANFDNSIYSHREDVVYEGKRYVGTDAVGKLCRELGEGVLEIYRDNVLSLTVSNISHRAGEMLQESSSRGFRRIPYREFEMG